MDLKEIESEGGDWIQLAYNRIKSRSDMNTTSSFGLKRGWKFLDQMND